MEIDGSVWGWRNHYGNETSDDRRLKIGRNEEMADTRGTVTTTWNGAPIVWVEELQEPLALFVISLEDGTEYLVSAHSFDEAWRIVTAKVAKQVMRQTGARAVVMSTPENIVWIPLPDAPGLLHVFEGKVEEMTQYVETEPAPTADENVPIWGLVIQDMQARDQFGRCKYGTPLQPFNGRDALKDAYQEALDLCVYLRQALYERDMEKAEE